MIGYPWRVEIPGRLAIEWCHEAPLRLNAGVEAEPGDGR